MLIWQFCADVLTASDGGLTFQARGGERKPPNPTPAPDQPCPSGEYCGAFSCALLNYAFIDFRFFFGFFASPSSSLNTLLITFLI